MSTRGVIAVKTGLGWKGVYNHLDSYPTYLGPIIWRELQEKGVERVVEEGIEQYPQGYRSFPDDPYPATSQMGPITNDNVDPLFHEWVYILDTTKKQKPQLTIITSVFVPRLKRGQKGTRIEPSIIRTLDGTIEHTEGGYYVHVVVCKVDIKGKEPNWALIEAKRDIPSLDIIRTEKTVAN